MIDLAQNIVDGCWAASLADCGGKLSREHTISECLFPSGKVTVRGFDWCRNEAKTIGVGSLVGRVLCERHNSSLSELDSEMLKCFESIRESARLNDVRKELGHTHWNIKRFEIDGRLLERWFLKTLINLNFEGRWKFGDDAESVGVPPKELVEMAFGRRAFEKHAGMYMSVRPGETIAMLDGVSFRALTELDRLVAGEFTICGYKFILSLVSEAVSEFAGSQLLGKTTNMMFRVPDRKNRMVRSHLIHIKR
jgi:hypothetical protein